MGNVGWQQIGLHFASGKPWLEPAASLGLSLIRILDLKQFKGKNASSPREKGVRRYQI
jgi:hypothetical protein